MKADKIISGYELIVDRILALDKERNELAGILRSAYTPDSYPRRHKTGQAFHRTQYSGTDGDIVVTHSATPTIKLYHAEPASFACPGEAE